jgi:hypothetical protein
LLIKLGDLIMATDENDLTPAKPVKAKLAKKKVPASKSIVKKKAVKPTVKKKVAKPVAKKKELASAIENTMEKNQVIKPVPKKKAVKPVLRKKAVVKKSASKKEMKVASGESPAAAKIKALKDNIAELNQELTDLKAEIKLTKKRENATALLANQREAAANKFLRGWDKKANAALEKSLAIKKKKKK